MKVVTIVAIVLVALPVLAALFAVVFASFGAVRGARMEERRVAPDLPAPYGWVQVGSARVHRVCANQRRDRGVVDCVACRPVLIGDDPLPQRMPSSALMSDEELDEVIGELTPDQAAAILRELDDEPNGDRS